MKRFIIPMYALILLGCHHSMDSWPSDGDKPEVAMFVRTRNLSGINGLPSNYQFFVYDKTLGTTARYEVNPDKDNNLHVKLFPGAYTGYCVTNASDETVWEYTAQTTPDRIYLKSQTSTHGTEEPRDYLLGQTDFEVNESG